MNGSIKASYRLMMVMIAPTTPMGRKIVLPESTGGE
jgi:hypothetical protein